MGLDFAALLRGVQTSEEGPLSSALNSLETRERQGPSLPLASIPPSSASNLASKDGGASIDETNGLDASIVTSKGEDASPLPLTGGEGQPAVEAVEGVSSTFANAGGRAKAASREEGASSEGPVSLAGARPALAPPPSAEKPIAHRPCQAGESYKAYRKKMASLGEYRKYGRPASFKARAKVLNSAVQQPTDLTTENLPAARDGYSGKNIHKATAESTRSWTVEELISDGFSLIKWDGW